MKNGNARGIGSVDKPGGFHWHTLGSAEGTSSLCRGFGGSAPEIILHTRDGESDASVLKTGAADAKAAFVRFGHGFADSVGLP